MKSYVSLEEKICPICGNKHDSGTILIDMRLKDSMEYKTLTGWGHCKDCKKKLDEGYIALVEVSNVSLEGNIMKQEDACRTGRLVWAKKHVCDEVFNMKITTPMVFVQADVVEYMSSLIPVE